MCKTLENISRADKLVSNIVINPTEVQFVLLQTTKHFFIHDN